MEHIKNAEIWGWQKKCEWNEIKCNQIDLAQPVLQRKWMITINKRYGGTAASIQRLCDQPYAEIIE